MNYTMYRFVVASCSKRQDHGEPHCKEVQKSDTYFCYTEISGSFAPDSKEKQDWNFVRLKYVFSGYWLLDIFEKVLYKEKDTRGVDGNFKTSF